jgi:hypothetical protein
MLRQMIILSAISFSFICADEGSIPDWYFNPPKEEGRLFGVGEGNLKMKAILFSLLEIETQITNHVSTHFESFIDSTTNDTVNKSVTRYSINRALLNDSTNGIHIESMTEHIINDDRESIQTIINLGFSKQGMESIIEYAYHEVDITVQIDNLRVVYVEMDETKLIEELERYGFRFEYALDEEGNHYVLINVDK